MLGLSQSPSASNAVNYSNSDVSEATVAAVAAAASAAAAAAAAAVVAAAGQQVQAHLQVGKSLGASRPIHVKHLSSACHTLNLCLPKTLALPLSCLNTQDVPCFTHLSLL